MLLQDGTGTVPWIRASFGQPCPSPDTPFPSAHGPVLPITGPTASSFASAKGFGEAVENQLPCSA